MASILRRGRRYLVRWRDPDGVERARTTPDLDTARRLRTEVERTVALGHRWEPADARALPQLLEIGQDEEGQPVASGGLFYDYLAAARARVSPGTYRHYDRALRRFLAWLAGRHPSRRRLTCELLTRDALEAWFSHLVTELPPPFVTGRPSRRADAPPRTPRQHPRPLGVSAARLAVGAVVEAWSWAFDSDVYGDVVGRVRRPQLPSPTGTVAVAPTWAQMDAVIGACLRFAAADPELERPWSWRARACIVLRFTGLRSSQVMRLRWDDVDFSRQGLTIRGELGKSRAERAGRMVPLAPAFVELLAGWGRREGWLVAPHKRERILPAALLVPAWEAARIGWTPEGGGAPIPARVFQARTDGKGQAGHAWRKGFKSGLVGLGVDLRVRDLLVGHRSGGVDAHYLDLWEAAVEAVGRIPPLSADATPATAGLRRVVPFR